MDNFVLNDGVEIPAIGLGTWQSSRPDAYAAVRAAVDCGYRHVDTAYVYENEDAVGKAVKDSKIRRGDIFLTTKLPSDVKDFKGAKEYCDRSLKALDTDYIDLYLIHAPWPWSAAGTDCSEGNVEVWRAMSELKKEGKIRSMGVSNFNGADIDNLIKNVGIVPSVNQIRFFIGNTQEKITEYCQKAGILVEAYSPLGTGKILENQTICGIAEKYGVPIAKLCIKFCIQRGTLPLPKSVTPERIKDNISGLDFTISDGDMAELNALQNLYPRPFRT